MDATEGIVRLVPDLTNTVMKRLERALELLVEAVDELLSVALHSARRDVLASSSSTQPAYS